MGDGKRELKDSRYFAELQTAFKAAEEAGDIIDDYARNGFETDRKDDGSRVTEADRMAQEKIVEVISGEFPDDGFLGEEEDLTPEGEDRVWVIDPLDGTFNFDSGFSHFCVSIALEVEGESVLGVVYSPESSLDRSYVAIKGEGTFRTGRSLDASDSISVTGQDRFEDCIYFLSSFDLYDDELDAELKIFKELAMRGGVHRQLGSCALEMCRVAAGQADIQITPIVKNWDYTAAKLIIEEAGGEVRIRDSKFPDCTEVFSSNGLLQEEVEDIVGERFR
jgi:myo-inositol-1(or 4)-monophosphatase